MCLSPGCGMSFPDFHVTVCLLCPLSLDTSAFGMPLLPGHRDRPGLLCFLGQASHRGSGASFPAKAGCSCMHTASGTRITNPNSLPCVYVLSEGMVRHEQRAQGSQLSPFPHKMQNFLLSARYTQSCVLAQLHGRHHLLPDGRKQACRRWVPLSL